MSDDLLTELTSIENDVFSVMNTAQLVLGELQKLPNDCDYDKVAQLSTEYESLIQSIQTRLKTYSTLLDLPVSEDNLYAAKKRDELLELMSNLSPKLIN